MKSTSPPSAPLVQPKAPPPRKWRPPQFTIFGIMVLTFVVAMAVTPLYYMIRAIRGETGFRAVAVLLSVALPMLVMIVLSVLLQINRWLKRRK
jgi:hypothetical protein